LQTGPSQLNAGAFGHYEIGIRIAAARTLWMRGFPDQALDAAGSMIKETEEVDRPLTFAYVFNWVLFVFARVGALTAAEDLARKLNEHSTKHALRGYVAAATGWRGVLALRRGEPEQGVKLLRTALARLHQDGFETDRPVFSTELAEGYISMGQIELAHATICEALGWAEERGPSYQMPELLRVKGETLLSLPQSSKSEGEQCLQEALQLARAQGALSLQLRTGMSLARLWAQQGLHEQALELLGPLHQQFSEGFQTPDLLAAARLLDDFRARS
jgi:predicted ATPase